LEEKTMSGRYEQKKPRKKKKSAAMVALIVLLVIVLLVVVGLGAFYFAVWKPMLNKVNYVTMPPKTEPVVVTTEPVQQMEATTQAPETTEATTEPTTVETTVPPMKPEDIINILVVGQSGREGEEARMADTMILVSLNTYTKTLTLSSVLRDTFAWIPPYGSHGEGRNKITNCYALGYHYTGETGVAMQMINECMEHNFGVNVDYDVEIDFEQFIHIIDFLGGVKIELNQAEVDYMNKDTVYVKRELQVGENRLDGLEALCFARMRHADGDQGDITRITRQQRLIESLIEQFRGKGIMRLQQLLNDCVLPFITTNMDPDTITNLTLKCLPMLADLKVEKGSCPQEGSYWGEMLDIYGDGFEHSILRFDENAVKKHMRAITEGEAE